MINIISAIYKRNRTTKKRAYPWTFVLGRLINGMSTVIFPFFIYTFLFGGQVSESFYSYTGSGNYMTYIVVGAAVQVLGIATLMNIGRALITELREGTLETFLLSPASRIGYFIGCQLEQITDSLCQFAIILVFGALLGANLAHLFSFQSILVIVLILYAFFSMGICLSSIMLYTRDTYICQNTLFVLMSVLCGVAFPIEYLPKYIQPLSHILPMTSAVKLFRVVVISGESISANLNLLYEMLGISTLLIIIGSLAYKKIEKNLVENIFG